MNRLRVVTGPMRVPFLILAPACAVLGISTVDLSGAAVRWWDVLLILSAAILGHISVNAFNEIDDFRTGLDDRTRRTPFSGGSGTLQAHPELLNVARAIAWGSLFLASAIGAWYIRQSGPVVAVIGLVGVVTVLGYTSFFVYSPVLCLISPGIGFGPVMVLGAHAALTGSVNLTAVLASLIPFFTVSNLLFLNQFPDVEADRAVGRRHIPILWGRKRSVWLYGIMHLAAFGVIAVATILGIFPPWSWLGVIPLPLAVMSTVTAARYADDFEGRLPALAQNVLVNLLTPTLLAVGIWIG